MTTRDDLMREEGLRLSAYLDHLGFWSLGYGRLIDSRKNGGISREEAAMMLDNDIARISKALDNDLTWWRSRPEWVQSGLIQMAYQLGIGGLHGFKVALSCLHAGDYAGARAAFLDSKWATTDTPARAARVVMLFSETEPRTEPKVEGDA